VCISSHRDGHCIQSAIAENLLLHANFAALSSIEPELLRIEVLYCEKRIFHTFCCCDLDPEPMTYIYKLDSYPLKMYLQTKNELYTSRLLKALLLICIGARRHLPLWKCCKVFYCIICTTCLRLLGALPGDLPEASSLDTMGDLGPQTLICPPLETRSLATAKKVCI